MKNKHTLILAHGAGAPMNSPWMECLTNKLEGKGVNVIRFEFPYMAMRRIDGKKRPPNPMPLLVQTYKEIIAQQTGTIFISGKSMGGRVATMVADACNNVTGVIAYGYPFHPPAQPEKLRTAHLQNIQTPCLIVQGSNDPFGKLGEWSSFPLGKNVSIKPIKLGNHDLKPLKRTGLSLEDALDLAVYETIYFMDTHK